MIILVILAILAVATLREPKQFTEVKEKYEIFLKNCPPEFPQLKKRILLSGYTKPKSELGYNVNKGGEIGLCLDGDSNQIFHVLLHELAHSTVGEYSHSEEFWNNFKKLRDHSVQLGIYTPIDSKSAFCGNYIRD